MGLERAKEELGIQNTSETSDVIVELFMNHAEAKIKDHLGVLDLDVSTLMDAMDEESKRPAVSNIDGETVESVQLVDLSKFTPTFVQEYREKLKKMMMAPMNFAIK